MNILNNLLTQLELATEIASNKSKETGQLYDIEMKRIENESKRMAMVKELISECFKNNKDVPKELLNFMVS